jgi:hypothetical protein
VKISYVTGVDERGHNAVVCSPDDFYDEVPATHLMEIPIIKGGSKNGYRGSRENIRVNAQNPETEIKKSISGDTG